MEEWGLAAFGQIWCGGAAVNLIPITYRVIPYHYITQNGRVTSQRMSIGPQTKKTTNSGKALKD